MNDNKVIEVINSRRSVRIFEQKPVPKEIIETIIEAGNNAPSTAPFQPWRFVVVVDPEFRKKLHTEASPVWRKSIEGIRNVMPEMYENAQAMIDAYPEPKDLVYYNAPVVLLVIGLSTNTVCCSLACENIMIAAQALGLGTCYVGFGAMVTGDPEIVVTLGMGEGERIFGPIVMGYPKENPDAKLVEAMDRIRFPKKPPTVKWI